LSSRLISITTVTRIGLDTKSASAAVGEFALSFSATQLDTLRVHLDSGVDQATEALRRAGLPEVRLELRHVTWCALGQFSERAPSDDEDVIAGAMMRFMGGLSGSALLALEPEDALTWVRTSTSDVDPIDRFLELGSQIVRGVVGALAEGWRRSVEFGVASLEEQPVLAVLLGTHAPLDTVLLSLHLQLVCPEVDAPACLHLLIEPKPLECLLTGGANGALARAANPSKR
jgi:hypothetical protein